MSTINAGFDNNSPQAIERSYGKLSAGRTVPFVSTTEANTAVISAYRHRGKTVLIDDGTGAKEYWWRVDTQGSSLVPKINGIQTLDFVVGDGGTYTPGAGTTVLSNPALVNCKVTDFQIEGAGTALFPRTGITYAAYDPVAGTITLTNATFVNTSWYSVKFQQL